VSIQRRAFSGAADLPLVADLIRAMPMASRHVVDFPWRLTAPDVASGRDAVCWQDADGRIVGLAAWQQVWDTLDFYIRPGPDAAAVERAVFAWAGGRFRERDAERGHPLPYSVEFRADDQGRQALTAAHGFVNGRQAANIHFERRLETLPPPVAAPSGFVIRPLAGVAEAAAYAEVHGAAFGGKAMTGQWRERILAAPLYQPDLDIVAVATDGTLAGFCVGWHEPARGVAQFEPVGVHPRYQRQGLGRALLTDMLQRFKRRGASVAIVETEFERTAARAAYRAVGFEQAHTIWRQEAWAAEVS
jgi:ribosomal protein S18 acetylase RimI-like enzyme